MPYNGAGTFSLYSPGNPVVTGTVISSTWANSTLSDIASGLSTAVTKSGQTTITANLPMAGFKITGLGAATARTDAASLATIQDGTGVYVSTVGGTADVITLTPSPAITVYAAGQRFSWIASGSNTTNVTVNVSGLGAKALTKRGSSALVANDITSGSMIEAEYDGTRFQLLNVFVATGTYLPVDGSTPMTGTLTFATTTPAKDLLDGICEGRLTLTTGVPVTTSNVTAATTVKFTPYKGNRVAVYDSTNWQLRTFIELSVAVPATTSTPFDIFIYDNSGTLTLETTNWTNATTRATALTTQNGVLVKSGAVTRRYLGTACTTVSSGQTEDSYTNRFLWNYYNRVRRPMTNTFTTGRATSSTSLTELNTEIRVNYLIGFAEESVSLSSSGSVSVAASSWAVTGIAVDSTTTSVCTTGSSAAASGVGASIGMNTDNLSAVGTHFATILGSTSVSACTWSGGAVANTNSPVILNGNVNG